jgi:hypothetical protein
MDEIMRGLNGFLFRGYMLHRTRGHWTELAVLSIMASIIWWVARVTAGIFLAVLSIAMLGYLFTR